MIEKMLETVITNTLAQQGVNIRMVMDQLASVIKNVRSEQALTISLLQEIRAEQYQAKSRQLAIMQEMGMISVATPSGQLSLIE